ncbi:MAG TPA: DUF3794 domain-containing protein [Oscillospiraceae bacterium]|nr:DUF3794 domain-containing protein [Oscillospiraceae bacterium]HPK36306.1 DUF3794 domain-containing protein [Oscillospiraceae bacterium]HPR76078.1 DUF3794 domain-containing protein [Oscillospiraceae bacterium]
MKMTKKGIGSSVMLFSAKPEAHVDSQAVIPDYLPEVQRVLRSDAEVFVTGRQIAEQKIIVEGNIRFCALYRSPDGELCSTNQTTAWRQTIDAAVPPDSAVFVTPRILRCSAQPISSRKIDLFGSFLLETEIKGAKREELLDGVEGADVELKKETVSIKRFVSTYNRQFTISEDLELENSRPSVMKLLCSRLYIADSDFKTVSGRVVVNGDAILEALYLGDVSSSAPHTIKFTIPFSQITELDSTDNSEIEVSVSVVSYALNVVSQPDGDNRRMSLDLILGITAVNNLIETVDLLFDGYSREFATEAQYGNFTAVTNCERFEVPCSASGGVDFGEQTIEKVLDTRCTVNSVSLSTDKGEVTVFGSVTAVVMASDEDGELSFIEKELEFEQKVNASGEGGELSVKAAVSGSKTVQTGSGMEIRADVAAVVTRCESIDFQLMTDLKVNEEVKKQPPLTPLVLCFAGTGEDLWEIAKTYNTSTDIIKTQNGIDSDRLTHDEVLLIPTV